MKALDRGDPPRVNVLRHADVKLDAERLGDLFLKEPAQAATLRIGAADQFVLIPAERKRVITVPCARLPGRRLSGDDLGQPAGTAPRS